jgi:hypothetical protein
VDLAQAELRRISLGLEFDRCFVGYERMVHVAEMIEGDGAVMVSTSQIGVQPHRVGQGAGGFVKPARLQAGKPEVVLHGCDRGIEFCRPAERRGCLGVTSLAAKARAQNRLLMGRAGMCLRRFCGCGGDWRIHGRTWRPERPRRAAGWRRRTIG